MNENPTSHYSDIPNLPKISGPIPGALDPTQRQRLCPHSGSKLLFAAFNPGVASSKQDIPDFRKLSLSEELYRPKRVVIETTSCGESSWRFVPNARRDKGVQDEGMWPRIVEICGRLYECTQDQWDIYKLDPFYDCYVRAYPNLTVISRYSGSGEPIITTKVGQKRRTLSPPSPETETQARSPRKKVQVELPLNSDGGEEGEVEGMWVEDGPLFSSTSYRERAMQLRERKMKNRQDRRDKVARRTEQLTMEKEGNLPRNSSSCRVASQPELVGKRKVDTLFDSLKSNGNPDQMECMGDKMFRNTMYYVPSKYGKRTRAVSPASAKRDLDTKRLYRERKKQKRWEEELKARRQERDTRFLREVYSEIPDPLVSDPQGGQDVYDDDAEGSVDVDDEDAVRNAAIAESRRKLADLEADRPLWDAAAVTRMNEERAEELRLARAQAERRTAAFKAEQEKREREENERIAREQVQKQERELWERGKCQRQSWLYGKWSPQRAMEKYLDLSTFFDGTRFSAAYPLTFDAVPWPVLQSPNTFAMEDVTWQAVEEFFDAFRPKLRAQDFKVLLEKSHRRFHPDRWRSRSLLTTVEDEVEREIMEIAANTVAQALTPMWQQLRGRRS